MNTSVPLISETPSPFDVVKALSQLDQQAIVRPTNPPAGIAGFLFDIPEEDSISLRSDITDHFIEDNTAIQDQIGLRPEEYKVRGLVAELAEYSASASRVASVPTTLPDNPALTPALTTGAAQTLAGKTAQTAAQTTALTNSQSLYNLYGQRAVQPPDATRQSRAFGYFYEMWKGRQLCTVETPWGYFTNMAVLSLEGRQEDWTKGQTSFSVTFKKIRVAQPVTVTVGQLAGRAIAGGGSTTPVEPVQAGRTAVQMAKAIANGVLGLTALGPLGGAQFFRQASLPP